MKRIKLGRTGPEVSPLGLGCMGMSGMYGHTDEAESVATIHAAIDSGINLLDTGDFYGMGHNEMLIRRALEGRHGQVVLSVKFGAMRAPDGNWIGFDGRPAAVKTFCAYSLRRLGVDVIDIYRPARLDPAVPIEETVGAIADLIQAGYVRYLGLSEAGAETVRRAHAVHPVTDLQMEYSIITRTIEKEILPVLRELGIGVTAYGVLSRGLLSDSRPKDTGDFRAHLPRFSGENYVRNRRLVEVLGAIAAEMRITPAQLAIAWVAAQGRDIVPVPGARTRNQLEAALGALEVQLSPRDLAAVDRVFAEHQVAGARYGEAQMKVLDSERG
ncbi:MAG TPA: aldo/keto reductase [Acidobacteriaceae bacterium]|nr:aldo/keto reductase [Acidobacteriaceae bacterium]